MVTEAQFEEGRYLHRIRVEGTIQAVSQKELPDGTMAFLHIPSRPITADMFLQGVNLPARLDNAVTAAQKWKEEAQVWKARALGRLGTTVGALPAMAGMFAYLFKGAK